MGRIHGTAMAIEYIGLLITCILPVCLLIFGTGSSNVLSGLALAFRGITVMIVLFSNGGFRLSLAYMTVILTAVLGRQFAASI